jgi:hypothetical protein
MTIVVNLIGAPGCGKSVFSGLIFAELKMMNYVTEYVQEFAKQLVWAGDLETLKNQYFVSMQQYRLLKNIDGKVDVIVTDGALMMGLYYNNAYDSNVSDTIKTEKKIKECMEEFKNIYIFLERGKFPYEVQGRIHSFEDSQKIEVEMRTMLDELKVEYLCITSNKYNLQQMIDYIITSIKKTELFL